MHKACVLVDLQILIPPRVYFSYTVTLSATLPIAEFLEHPAYA